MNDRYPSINNKLKSIIDEHKVPLSDAALNNIAQICPHKKLPLDFITLNKKHRADFFSFFDFFNFGNKEGVVEETLYYREKENLPHNYIVLFSDDVSFVLLKTLPDKASEVIWCDEPDFYNLCRKGRMEYKATVFNSFTDFYEFLLDEEEKLIEEEKKNSNRKK